MTFSLEAYNRTRYNHSVARRGKRMIYRDQVLDTLIDQLDAEHTQLEFSKKLGYSQSTFSALRRGKNAPSYFFIRTIAEALGYRLKLEKIK